MSVLCPGHPIGPNEVDSTRKSFNKFLEIFKEHDAIFLLTDSRESRWLPTLLGSVYKKVMLHFIQDK